MAGRLSSQQMRKRPAGVLRMSVGERRPSIKTEAKRRRKSLSFSNEPVECAICCVDVAVGSAIRLGCSHGWYCKDCVRNYAVARLNEGAVDVSCPDCREPIPDYDLKNILTQDTINRFHERSISRAVASSSNLYACPTPDCGVCFEVEEGDDYHLRRCNSCLKGSCLRCGAQPYHHGLSCQEHAAKNSKRGGSAEDVKLWRWMRRTGTVQCPQCKMGVSKEDLASQQTQRKECHKMICRGCMTKFCFKCKAILTDSYTCGCSINAHRFVNPFTGKSLQHLKTKEKVRRSSAGG